MQDREYDAFVDQIKQYTGIDLHAYKESQMNRRLRALYQKKGYMNYADYFFHIQKDKTLLDEFLDRMTINVSEFLRNPNRWDVFETYIKQLSKTTARPRLWSAACSTGEEPYTMAILLSKYIPLHTIRILATDIDEKAIEKAKKGVYAKNALKNLSDATIQQYFRPTYDGMYAIHDELKACVEFKKHDLLQDPFEYGFDLIVCRNVVIYFTEEAKNKLYEKFSNSLKSGGLLFVGSTEQIFQPSKYTLDVHDSFFYKKTK